MSRLAIFFFFFFTRIDFEQTTEDDQKAHEQAKDETGDGSRDHGTGDDQEDLTDRDRFIWMEQDTQEDREDASDRARDQRLDLNEGHVSPHQRLSGLWMIELAHVGTGRKACGQVHFQIAFQVEQDGHEDEQFGYVGKDIPVLQERSC